MWAKKVNEIVDDHYKKQQNKKNKKDVSSQSYSSANLLMTQVTCISKQTLQIIDSICLSQVWTTQLMIQVIVLTQTPPAHMAKINRG